MSSIMWASSPMISLIFSLSSLVDFLTLVPTTSRPASCRAATTDQLFTPPVMSSTFLPEARPVGGDAVPGALLLDRDQGLGAVQQIGRGASLHQQPGQLAQGVAHVLDAVERASKRMP
jgi:hypothetical protein